MSRPMPRLFVVRHGPTEWSKNGRHTGRSDIPLTPDGEDHVKIIAERLVGPGLAIDPAHIGLALISPRIRAQKTVEIMFANVENAPALCTTEEVREWDYGDFEGLKSHEIRAIKPIWAIWKDGCPGGESPSEMEARVDEVIRKVREHHKRYLDGECETRDVLIVAHGHFNRVMIARWCGFPLSLGTFFNVEPASVAVLGYNHNNLAEPAVNALNLYAKIL